jgi:hypothetical protein
VATLERATTDTSVIDALDRVLDKGIVLDAWMRLAVGGIDLLTMQARVVVASMGTHLTYAHTVAESPTVSPQTRTFEEQLHLIREQLEMAAVPRDEERRRIGERLLEELHDAAARTVNRRRRQPNRPRLARHP